MLTFKKLHHLQTNPYRVYTDNELFTGTATVHCRDEQTGKLLPVENVTILVDNDFVSDELEVAREYAFLMKMGEID